MEGVPQAHRTAVQEDLLHQSSRFARGIGKAVEQRDRSDVRSGIAQTIEHAQRLYLENPAAADQMANDTLTQLGPFGGMAPAEIQQARQAYMEGTRFTKGQAMVSGARRDNAALDKVAAALESEQFQDMDPGRKGQLLTQIEGYKVSNVQRMEADARRRQAEEERRMRHAESQFNAANSIITTGKVLSPEYVEQVSKSVAGTPYELAFKESLKQAPERTAFGMQPLATMERILTQARAELNARGTNPQAEKTIKAMEEIRNEAVKDYARDPLLAAQERGLIQTIQPVDVSSVSGLLSSIAPRIEQAGLVRQQVGQPVTPLLKSEAETVAKLLNVLPLEQRSAAVAQLAQAVGPEQAAALAKQLMPAGQASAADKALAIAFGMAGARTTEGRYTSELVLRGAAAIKDKAVREDNAALTGIRAQVAAEIGDAYQNQEVRAAMIDAAVYTQYGLQAEGSGDLSRAVRLATGGITERAGRKVPLPYGVDADTFEKRLVNLSPPDIEKQLPDGKVYVAGTAMPSANFLKQVPQAALMHAGQGRYWVQAGTGLATNAVGRPLVIEVK
jgi:hypothetical protein